jgi:hypothetical protein
VHNQVHGCRIITVRQIDNHYKIMKTLLTFIIGVGLALTSFGDQTNTPAADGLFSHAYRVETQTFVIQLRQLAPPKPGESNQELLRRFLQEQHVTFQKPAGVSFNEKHGIVSVHGTKDDLKKADAVILRIVRRS